MKVLCLVKQVPNPAHVTLAKTADVGLVGDWRETLPTLVDALEGKLAV